MAYKDESRSTPRRISREISDARMCRFRALDSAKDRSKVADPNEAAAAWEAFMQAGRQIASRFRSGVSGVRLLSRMRR
jgi:hypothetical protein